ncbi:hypothetical protein RISK_006489 [Rhodopirellula islandica]|uniref:Uncharacterized protein n=1 Tax=Rhodopirellula islandica TaxID=595434 RepID=A0A0J1B401_RHOIS|nr:hypothetical protein RISK_006489 [Rhodopirellula islandica]
MFQRFSFQLRTRIPMTRPSPQVITRKRQREATPNPLVI